MTTPLRNSLVWLHASGWQSVADADWDAQARAILDHWQLHDLPLVVARRRTDTPDGLLSLGLPAPAQWDRRRLCLFAAPIDVRRNAPFPALDAAARCAPLRDLLGPLANAMQSLGQNPQVYGSAGWQFLTGMSYVHADSDVDLRFELATFSQALNLAARMGELEVSETGVPRIDGEIVLPCGWAFAWRELRQLGQGHTRQVLARSSTDVQLMDRAQLESL